MKQINRNRKTRLMIGLLLLVFGFAQAQNFPYGINYQAVARDANGNAKTNTTIGTKYSIRSGSATGTLVWQETQSVITNAMGQFNHTIGNGTRIGGTTQNFNEISWTTAGHYLEVEIQIGALPYVSIGNQQLMSVPYALATPNGVPTGAVMPFAGPVTSPPPGWLVCDGSEVNRVTHATLFAAIGISWGAGDGTTTFNLPDMRGVFLRGVDGTAGNDPDASVRVMNNAGGNIGNAVGSEQTDSFKSHSHTQQEVIWPNGGSSWAPSSISTAGSGVMNTMNTLSTGGNETRPKNVYVNYIIKY